MTEPTIPQESAIVEVPQETTDLVKKEMPADTPEQVIKETAALFESLKTRAQLEMEAATELSREAYMKSVRSAREAIEENQSVAKEQLDRAFQLVQEQTEKTWLLIDAMKTRAQSEIQSAGDVTRDNYLKAVRQAKEAIEQDRFIEKDRIEQAVQEIQQQAEKNWQIIVIEIESIGLKLTEVAKNAWNALMAHWPKSDRD